MPSNTRHTVGTPAIRWLLGIIFGTCVAVSIWQYFRLRPFTSIPAAESSPFGEPNEGQRQPGDSSGDSPAPPSPATHSPATLSSVPSDPHRLWQALDDPQQDGWDSEFLSGRIDSHLEALGAFIVQPGPTKIDAVQAITADQFTCPTLLPESKRVYVDDGLEVRRSTSIENQASSGKTWHRGGDGLIEALRQLSEPLRSARDLRFKFKLTGIDVRENEVRTSQLVSFSGRTKGGYLEQNAEWRMRWELVTSISLPSAVVPKLHRIDIEQFEQVLAPGRDAPMFVECTPSILQRNDSYRQQFLIGLNEWLERIQDTRYFSPLGNPGVAIGDVNGDGLDDLYVCQESGLPNRLFLQQSDGSALDASETWGVDWLESSRGALIIDLDNDADQDLVVAMIGGIVVARNDQQRFTVAAMLATDDDLMSLSAADFDNDGDLDIYGCVNYPNDFFAESEDISVLGGASNRVYHDANNAGKNALFRNDIADGNWVFTNVTDRVGLDANNRRFSLAAAWEDIDNDGDQDLYVGNDFGRNNLYRNRLDSQGADNESTFEDIARSSSVEDSASGMSVAWGDVNRDGRMDLYVGNMFSAAGSRITSQPRFKPSASRSIRGRLRRFARGNSLFKNQGKGTFQDVSMRAGVNVGRWAWSSNFVDINNDGWEDLIVANGYITADDTSDL